MKEKDEIFQDLAEIDDFARAVIPHVENYLRDLEGNPGLPLYEMIQMAFERPLLRWAMIRTDGNQCSAAKLLGINRNTLHKKLVAHGLLSGWTIEPRK